ncbi:choice-of-anchor L domain-containing protein [Capnocytophaga sp. ARDL2]|uniref:T9SS type B sorting domain-containing protein n=1 Tax=Capnocytophaga sp. ARDL2 TaxID=3238809 RepID=UPI003557BF04
MKIIFSLSALCGYSQPITVSSTSHTPVQLVENVLVSGPCATVSNINAITGTNFGSDNGIGYFTNTNPAFPMESGVVLSTGRATAAQGPQGALGQSFGVNSWPHDVQLTNYLNGILPFSNYYNATILEFDFVPQVNEFSFNFIFASNEYGNHQCSYSDSFAFFLTNVATGETTNLAIVPGTNDPISVITIRDSQYIMGGQTCPSVNPQFFGNFNVGQQSAINFNGETVKMTAGAEVIPGQTYRIKLVIQDRGDVLLDSAVFLEAGSFSFGEVQLGTDRLVVDGTAICEAQTHLLDTALDPALFHFQWTKDGNYIIGANGPSYEVTAPGVYGVIITSQFGGCIINPDPITIEQFDAINIDLPLQNLSQCKMLGDFTYFDLRDAHATMDIPHVAYSFYLSAQDAENAENEIPYTYAYDNTLTNEQTIYVRIQRTDAPCYKVRSFTVSVNTCELALNYLPDLHQCMANQGSVTSLPFDLEPHKQNVYWNNAGFTVTFHSTEDDAINQTNAIPDAQLSNYNGTNGERLWVRVTNNDNFNEYGVTSFYLYISPLPNIPATLPVAIACDNGNGAGTFDLNLSTNQITLSPMLTVSYYANEADAELGYVELQLPLSYTSTPGTIYVRVQNATTGCYVVRPLQLSLRALPTAIEIPGLTLCDQGNDGRSVFNLQATAIQIAGNPIPEGVQVTYHETLTDANLNQNAIATPTAYENIVLNNQTVYVRVGYQNSNCASVVPLELNVTPTPELGALSHSLYACDTDNDLIEVFDLTEATSVFLGSLDAGQYTVTYHTTQELALTGSNSIVNPTAFSNATASTIYVRVANNATGCTSVGILNLRINRTPVVPAVVPSYTLCDENGNGFETFDLLSRIPLIIGEQQGLGVTFHYTANDALTGVNPLPTTYQNVVANVQTLYIRVVNQSTGCFSTTTMDIRVEPNPQITLPTEPFSICNIGGTGGFGTIDLVEHILPLVQGTGFAVSYFETQNNAINNIQPIAVPQAYNNLQTTTPVVWIRVTNAYGCFTVYPITFHLETAPAMPVTLPEVNVCDTFGETNDGISIFDLTVQNALIYATNASVDPSELEIKYYTSLANAEQGINWIGNPTQYENTENPQTIWVTVNRVGSKCLRLRSFTIQTRMPLALTTPTTISKCETTLPNVGQEQVDLTIREVQIQGGVQVFGVTFAYYTSAVDRANEVNAIADPTTFVTSTANQTIYIAVTNQYGCVSYTELEVRILPLPEINESPTPLKACVSPDNAPLGIFDLTSKQFEISNDIANLTFRYYTNSDGAYTADPNSLIMNPTQYLAQTGIVYVRVSNNPTIESNSCFVVVPLQLVVLPTVNVPQLSPMYVCIENTNGYHTFNLEDKKSEILGNLPAGDYMVKYYTSEENAINDNAPVPYIYTNIVQTVQEIWVRVYHNEVGCFGIGSFELRVEEEVKAFMPVSTAFCEDDAQNDGNTVMDLTRLNAEIIGTQISTPLSVRYFDAQGNLIADPTSYNGTDGDEITAVVFNTIPGMQCRATVTFTVTTIPGPEVPNIPNGVVCFDFHNPSELIKGYTMDTRLPEGGDYTFQWMDGNGVVVGTGSSYIAVAPGDYTLIVTYLPTGCTSTRTIVVTEGPRITLEEIRFTEDFSELISMEVIANAGNGVTLEYQLDEGEWQESNVFMNVIPGEHMLRIRVKNGVYCPLEKEVLVMGHPLFFTPNNDGQNDTWNIRALKDQPDSKIYIFDRYGKLLKQISGSGPGWDGTYNGQPMPATDYWFKVIYVDKRTGLEKEATGHFSLIR